MRYRSMRYRSTTTLQNNKTLREKSAFYAADSGEAGYFGLGYGAAHAPTP
jgi:hypothetical protein